MLSLINILIIFFIVLILYQILLAINVVEGFENQYQQYNTNNPNNALILAQQNAGNISYLKERLDSLESLNDEVQDISNNLITLQGQVNGLVQAQQEYTTQMTGGQTPVITGAVSEDNNSSTSTNLESGQ
jgi:predicted PurR-regulated permease PerM